MKLPVGMLIYWAHRFQEDHAVISGMWYYQEMYVPSTIEEKKQSILDLKTKKCTALNINGTFEQILDLLMQTDRFHKGGDFEIKQFASLKNELLNAPENKACLFDEINNLKGTSLLLDTAFDIDETMEDIMAKLKSEKVVNVYISRNWSYANDLNNMLYPLI